MTRIDIEQRRTKMTSFLKLPALTLNRGAAGAQPSPAAVARTDFGQPSTLIHKSGRGGDAASLRVAQIQLHVGNSTAAFARVVQVVGQ